MNFTFYASLCLGHLIFIFFNTDFFYEYGSLFKLSKVLDLDNYKEWKDKEANAVFHYPVYYREKHSNFFSRLIGCPICLSTFLGTLITLSLVGGALACFVYFVENILYNLNNFIENKVRK